MNPPPRKSPEKTKETKEITDEVFNEVFLTHSKIGKYFSIPEDNKEIMLQYFKKKPYPKKDDLLLLNEMTGIEKSKIQNWFK